MIKNSFYNNNLINRKKNIFLKINSENENKLELISFELIKENYLNKSQQIIFFQSQIKKNSDNQIKKINKVNKGRRKKEEISNENAKHSRKSFDNLLRKIKVLFHNFIIEFLNNFVCKIFGSQRLIFRKISGKVTKNISKDFNKKLAKNTIKTFIENTEISSKYNHNKDKNKKNCKKLYFLNEEFRKILNFNYLSFYKKFFLCKNKEFLIKKFGLNEEKSKNLFIYIENQKKLFNNNKEEINYLELLEYSATNKFIEFIKDENINEKINNLFLNKNDDEKTIENSDKKSNFSEDFETNEGKIFFNVIK
jgi:hypothetical protein